MVPARLDFPLYWSSKEVLFIVPKEKMRETRPAVRGCQKLFPKIEARQALPPEVLSHSEDQRTQFKIRMPRERGNGPTGLDLRGERGETVLEESAAHFPSDEFEPISYHIGTYNHIQFTVADTTGEHK